MPIQWKNVQPVEEGFSASRRRLERLCRSSDHEEVFRTRPVHHRRLAVELGQLRVEAKSHLKKIFNLFRLENQVLTDIVVKMSGLKIIQSNLLLILPKNYQDLSSKSSLLSEVSSRTVCLPRTYCLKCAKNSPRFS